MLDILVFDFSTGVVASSHFLLAEHGSLNPYFPCYLPGSPCIPANWWIAMINFFLTSTPRLPDQLPCSYLAQSPSARKSAAPSALCLTSCRSLLPRFQSRRVQIFRAFRPPVQVVDRYLPLEPWMIIDCDEVKTFWKDQSTADLRHMASTWGLSQGGRKALAGEIAHRLCDFAGDHLGNKDQLRVLRSSWHALTWTKSSRSASSGTVSPWCMDTRTSGHRCGMRQRRWTVCDLMSCWDSFLIGAEISWDFIIEFVRSSMNWDISNPKVAETWKLTCDPVPKTRQH